MVRVRIIRSFRFVRGINTRALAGLTHHRMTLVGTYCLTLKIFCVPVPIGTKLEHARATILSLNKWLQNPHGSSSGTPGQTR